MAKDTLTIKSKIVSAKGKAGEPRSLLLETKDGRKEFLIEGDLEHPGKGAYIEAEFVLVENGFPTIKRIKQVQALEDTDSDSDAATSKDAEALETIPDADFDMSHTEVTQKIGKATLRIEILDANRRTATAIAAFCLGGIGAHKFLLGRKLEALIMLAAFVCGVFLYLIPTFLVIIVALFEGFKYLTMNDEKFAKDYIVDKRKWF